MRSRQARTTCYTKPAKGSRRHNLHARRYQLQFIANRASLSTLPGGINRTDRNNLLISSRILHNAIISCCGHYQYPRGVRSLNGRMHRLRIRPCTEADVDDVNFLLDCPINRLHNTTDRRLPVFIQNSCRIKLHAGIDASNALAVILRRDNSSYAGTMTTEILIENRNLVFPGNKIPAHVYIDIVRVVHT